MAAIELAPPPAKARASHTCKYCHKTFKRSEHCIRHERSRQLTIVLPSSKAGFTNAVSQTAVRSLTVADIASTDTRGREFVKFLNPGLDLSNAVTQ